MDLLDVLEKYLKNILKDFREVEFTQNSRGIYESVRIFREFF